MNSIETNAERTADKLVVGLATKHTIKVVPT